LIYVFNWSASNLVGRGDVAPERGLAGDLMPDNVELAMMKTDDRIRRNGTQTDNVVLPKVVCGSWAWRRCFVVFVNPSVCCNGSGRTARLPVAS
jgi:hypothetical protein